MAYNEWSVPSSSDLNPLDYQAWEGNARVLLQAATEAKTVTKFTVYRCTFADLVCIARKKPLTTL